MQKIFNENIMEDGGKKTPCLCRNKDKNILDFLSKRAMQVQI